MNNKIKNIPKEIYLIVGFSDNEFTDVDCNDLKEVTWAKEKLYDADIKYVLAEQENLISDNAAGDFLRSKGIYPDEVYYVGEKCLVWADILNEYLSHQSAPINEVKEEVIPSDLNNKMVEAINNGWGTEGKAKLCAEVAEKYFRKLSAGKEKVVQQLLNKQIQYYELAEKIKNLPQTYGEKGLGKVYDIAIQDVLNLLK